jgi:hypothetical protein
MANLSKPVPPTKQKKQPRPEDLYTLTVTHTRPQPDVDGRPVPDLIVRKQVLQIEIVDKLTDLSQPPPKN